MENVKVFLIILFIFFISCERQFENPVDPRVILGTITDIDGNVYKTVKIGNQWWMAENLKY